MAEDISDILGEGPPSDGITHHPEPEGGWRGGDVVKESRKGRWCFAGYHPDGSIRFAFKVTPHFATPEGYKDINRIGTNGSSKTGKAPLWMVIRAQTDDGAKLVAFAVEVALGQGKCASASIRDRLTALQWLSDRGFGKAKETVVLENPDGTPLQPSQTVNILPPAEIYAQLARVARALETEDQPRGARSLPARLEGTDPALPAHPDGTPG